MRNTSIESTDFGLAASKYSIEVIAVIISAMVLLSLLILIGNILVIYIYYHHKNLHIPKNYFILSLAIADVFIGIFSVNFYTVYLASGYWPLGDVACDLWLAMDYSCCNASTLNLLAISVERYMSIRHAAFHRNQFTRQRLKKIILGLWFLSFAVWFPAIFAYPYIYGERTVREGECYIQFLYESPAVTIVTAFINFYGPIILMFVIYVAISWTLVKRYKSKYDGREKPGQPYIAPETSSRMDSIVDRRPDKTYDCIASRDSVTLYSQTPSSIPGRDKINGVTRIKRKHATQRQKDYLSHKRAVTLLLLIILAFAITWFPYHLLAVIAPFCEKCIKENWWHFAYIFCYVNSLLNPFCYAFGNRHFKKYFWDIFRKAMDKMTFIQCTKGNDDDDEVIV